MEFTLYIGTKKVKHAIRYTYSKYVCTRLSRTKGRYNLDKTPIKSRNNGCPNYIKKSNQHKIDSKDLSHYKKLIKPKTSNEIARFQQINQTLTLFMMAQVPKIKGLSSQIQILDNDQEMLSILTNIGELPQD